MQQMKSQHQEVVDNLIPRDIRNLIPEMGEPPLPSELAHRIQIDNYLEEAEEIYRLNLITEQGAMDDLHRALQHEDPDLKGIAWGCLGGIHAFNGNYKKAFSSFVTALEQEVAEDAKAYIITELSNLLRKLGYEKESLSILGAALRMTKNEKLSWRIKTYMALCQKYDKSDTALKILHDSEEYYRKAKEYPRLGVVLRHTASIYIKIGQPEDAVTYVESALEIAEKHNLKSHRDAALNEKGWMLINLKQYDEAKELYERMLENDLSPYDKSLALQNLGFLEYERRHFKEAVKYHSQSLRLTTWYEMRDMAFEDFCKLGLCHEKLGDRGLADHFYRQGYMELQKEVELGLPLVGFRKRLLDAYVDFLNRNQSIPYTELEDETFGFAVDKSFKEIRKIFQKSLLTLHLERSKTAPEMCTHLKIDTRTYFLYQKRLGLKRGKPRKGLLLDNPYFTQYVDSLTSLPWREANRKFEEDVFSYLMTKYQHSKTELAKALDVSYAQVVLKTKKS